MNVWCVCLSVGVYTQSTCKMFGLAFWQRLVLGSSVFHQRVERSRSQLDLLPSTQKADVERAALAYREHSFSHFFSSLPFSLYIYICINYLVNEHICFRSRKCVDFSVRKCFIALFFFLMFCLLLPSIKYMYIYIFICLS